MTPSTSTPTPSWPVLSSISQTKTSPFTPSFASTSTRPSIPRSRSPSYPSLQIHSPSPKRSLSAPAPQHRHEDLRPDAGFWWASQYDDHKPEMYGRTFDRIHEREHVVQPTQIHEGSLDQLQPEAYEPLREGSFDALREDPTEYEYTNGDASTSVNNDNWWCGWTEEAKFALAEPSSPERNQSHPDPEPHPLVMPQWAYTHIVDDHWGSNSRAGQEIHPLSPTPMPPFSPSRSSFSSLAGWDGSPASPSPPPPTARSVPRALFSETEWHSVAADACVDSHTSSQQQHAAGPWDTSGGAGTCGGLQVLGIQGGRGEWGR
ncbi:hypothetical protein C0991_000571 [Blastosporella zonata]|nr:hypothetical protein C0991_000571 [Blastosporella zonata]